MGLKSLFAPWRTWRRDPACLAVGGDGPHPAKAEVWRTCRFEQVEERCPLAADIQLGAVYEDPASGTKAIPNTFTLSWSGGAPGTELKQLTISTDPNGNPTVQLGDPFFDTASGPPGVYSYAPLSIISHNGFEVTGQTPAMGSTLLVLNFSGFTAGKQLIFTIDVEDLDTHGVNATVNGHEFEGSQMIGTFSAPHYQDDTLNGTFEEFFQNALDASGLSLPNKDYLGGLIGGKTVNTVASPVYTAGAFAANQQTPLPITLDGTVYYDPDLDNVQQTGEPGIQNVQLSLLGYNGTTYAPTGLTATTDASGDYKFTGVLPGEYEIVETQPDGYLPVGSSAGNVNGVTYGVVTNAHTLSNIAVLGGEDVVQNDFSQSLPNSISGTVRVAPIGGGEPSDAPKSGVQVVLLDQNGNPTGSTTTAGDGSYSFINLGPGKYTVKEVVPTGYYAINDLVGNQGGAAIDLQTLANIVLTSNEKGVRYDFYLQQPVDLGGTVRVSPMGTHDANSTPLGGVSVQLLDARGNVLQTATTAADGTYNFPGAGPQLLKPGVYTVHELAPGGSYATYDSIGNDGGAAIDLQTLGNITLTSGQSGVQYDFWLQQPVTIQGTVRISPMGTHDANSTPLGGITVQLLDANGNVLQTASTAADGTYSFPTAGTRLLKPGSYTVHELTPSGYYATFDAVGNQGGSATDLETLASITLSSGQGGDQYDFWLQQPVSISGYVHVNVNGNCETDPNAPPLAGVTIQLLDAQGNVLGATTTDANGFYTFQQLHPGVYGTREIVPVGDFAADDHVGGAGGALKGPTEIDGATLTSGQSGTHYDYCVNLPVSISGYVHIDVNGNCVSDPNAPPLAGVTIQLLDAQGNAIGATTTDSNGFYSFQHLPPGVYGTREIVPTGDFADDDHVGSAGGMLNGLTQINGASLTSGMTATHYDFCVLLPVSVSGYVHVDVNGNCVTDPNAPPLAGVTIQLLDANGNVIGATTTDSNGFYAFDHLPPGTYGVRELVPAGDFADDDHVGSAGGSLKGLTQIDGASLTSGMAGTHYDFCVAPPVSIAGFVKLAIYGDCETTPTDPPLAGVTIELLDAKNSVIATTQTDAAGQYVFTGLPPGTYGVEEVVPPGFFYSDQHIGSAGGVIADQGTTNSIGLAPGQIGVGYNFCLVPPSTISGYVFIDGPPIATNNPATDLPSILANLPNLRTGIRQPGDAPVPGVTLMLANAVGMPLLNQSGNPIEATTDANGYYQFTGLPAGLYSVIKLHPQGYIDGINQAGTLGGQAISPTLIQAGAQSVGVSVSDALLQAVGSTNDAIAMIPLSNGQASLNNNFSEITLTTATPPLPIPSPIVPPDNAILVPAFTPLSPPPAPPIAAPPGSPFLFGSWGISGATWHLSVVDAGLPRTNLAMLRSAAQLAAMRADVAAWFGARLRHGLWKLHPQRGTRGDARQVVFGKLGGIPVTGDFDGDGITDVGVYFKGEWFIDLNGNGIWDDSDLWAKLGNAHDKPVTGDWDGDGKTDIGIFGPAWPGDPRAVAAEPGLPDPYNRSTGAMKNVPPSPHHATIGHRELKRTRDGSLRADLIDHVFHYGQSGDIPVTGDWTGTGIDSIGIFNAGQWVLDVDGDGKRSEPDITLKLGERGDKPVVGDFDGDGVDELGIYRDGHWQIDINHDGVLDDCDLHQNLGDAGHNPVVGDWDGDGIDQIGIHQEQADHRGDI